MESYEIKKLVGESLKKGNWMIRRSNNHAAYGDFK